MKFKNKKLFIIVGPSVMVCLLVVATFVIINKKQSNVFVNIDDLEPEFIEQYFNDYEKLNKKNDKSNILIVTTKKKLKNTYGATDIVNAPNNQYFLQYDSEDAKNKALESFKKDSPDIDVSENIINEISEDTVLVSSYNSWGVEAMGIDTLLDKFQDKELNDVTVAIIDTGLDLNVFNENFPDRLAGTYNVLESSDNNEKMYDNNGHGTHIAGTIAESTPSNVKILPVKVSDSRNISTTDAITAINYVALNKTADIMNMSYGSYSFKNAEYIAIEAAKVRNIISVAAAGNDNTESSSYPASYDNAISIAAVDSNREKAYFSNYGDGIMFATPGVDIKSIAKEEANRVMSGTSMATPHATGAVADLKSLNKNLTMEDIVILLRRYSDDLGDIGWDKYYGFGFINFTEAELCDGTDCDEYDVFKKSSRDNLEEIIESYEIEPVLTTYNYNSVNNILGTKVILNYTNGKTIEYKLSDISNLKMSDYDPYSTEKQTINISFTTSIGYKVNDSFEITNPSSYDSVWGYEVVGDNNIELTEYKDTGFNSKELYFPSEIDGYTVTGIADRDKSMFMDVKDSFASIQKVYLPSSIVKIGNHAFDVGLATAMNTLKSYADNLSVGDSAFTGAQSLINLDANISYVGDYGFYFAMALYNFPFSDNITHIGNNAFQNAFAEGAEITIPESVTEIGEGAFRNSSLKKITFLNKMETIPNNMMVGNINLEKVVLPEGVKEIGTAAFYNNKSLKEINLPDSLTTIGVSAFEKAFNGGKLVIPKNVVTIGNDAFLDSNPSELEFLSKMEAIPYRFMFNNTNLEKVKLYDGLKEIGREAFSGCKKISEINLPESLTTIDTLAFYNAFDPSANISIVIPKNVETIGGSVFSGSGLHTVNILGNITSIPISMFNNNKNLESVTFSNSVTEIEKYAFEGCSSLKAIEIPKDVTSIGEAAFKDCSSLSKIDLPNNITTIETDTFSGCSGLTGINIPSSVTTIGVRAFRGAFKDDSNVKITIPKNVTELGPAAFAASDIKEIEFLNDNLNISNSLFRLSEKLEKVTLPKNITEIGESAFEGCQSLKGISLPESLITIGKYAFSKAFDINSNAKIIIPKSITTMGYDTFYASGIKELTILYDIETLPYSMFSNSSSLEKVTLPNSLISVSKGQFSGCTSLKEVHFGKNISSIENGTFDNIKDKVTFYVYGNTVPKEYAETNNINYILIDSSISFDANGGTVNIGAKNIPDDGKYGELPIPYKENNGFKGWYCEDSDSYVNYNDEAICDKLVAKWQDDAYTVVMNANGGQIDKGINIDNNKYHLISESIISTTGLNADTYTTPDGMFVKDDMVLKEWNTKADGSGKGYAVNASVNKEDIELENNTLTLYAIWRDRSTYIINDYDVDETNHYINRIIEGTSVEEFKNKIELGNGYRVEVETKNVNGKEVMYTGGMTKIYNGDNLYASYTNVVLGDVHGDGVINSGDLLSVRQHLLGTKTLSGANFLAADVRKDDSINSADLLKIRQHLLGTGRIS